VAVPVDGMGTASVAPVMAPPVLGMQKPPRWVGKRFQDHLMEAPEERVKKPVGLKMRPLGCSRTAWDSDYTQTRDSDKSHDGYGLRQESRQAMSVGWTI
jgi:hypothetical protein